MTDKALLAAVQAVSGMQGSVEFLRVPVSKTYVGTITVLSGFVNIQTDDPDAYYVLIPMRYLESIYVRAGEIHIDMASDLTEVCK